MCCGQMQNLRSEGSKEQADVGDLLAMHGQGDIWAWVTAKGHVWVIGPIVARVCADICSS